MPEALSGVVLAGGRSRRMGRDKAFLTYEGETLVRRQAALLSAVGCEEILISGRHGVDYGVPHARLILDGFEDQGPLAGLVAAFAAMKHPRLLALAVDLPHMSPAFLKRVITLGDSRVSAVPHGRHGFEPLGACYAQPLRSLACAALARHELSLQTLMATAEAAGLVRRLAIDPRDERVFTNWNLPEDVPT